MQRFVTLDSGVRLEYVESGAPDGPPVILLHGVTDSWHAFERILPLLPPTLRTFAISQRGHGDSSRPAAGYRLDELAEDVRGFMDALALPSATLVGHSMGSAVAQHTAALYPERVGALVLMGAFATFQGPVMRDFVVSSIRPLRDPIDREFAREWQLSTLARPMDATHLDTVIDETLKVPAFVWHAAFEGFLAAPDWTPALARVNVPTLLLWGEEDTYADRRNQQTLLGAIPHARLITYPGAGHAFHWEDPVSAANDLAAFLLEVHANVEARPIHGAVRSV